MFRRSHDQISICKAVLMIKYWQFCPDLYCSLWIIYGSFPLRSDIQIFTKKNVQMIRYLQWDSALLERRSDICWMVPPPFGAVLPIESWFTRTLEGIGKAGAPILTIPTKKGLVHTSLLVATIWTLPWIIFMFPLPQKTFTKSKCSAISNKVSKCKVWQTLLMG